MNQSAHVTSVDALKSWKRSLQKFAEETQQAIDSLQIETLRVEQWLAHDRPNYWKQQVRQAYDRVAATRVELMRCRMRKVGDRPPTCYEEQKAHQAAKLRLQHCQDMIQVIRRWSVKYQHDLNEYRGRIGKLENSLNGDVPKMLALMDRSIDALLRYVETTSPEKNETD